jgi:hypothetical protein
MKRKVDAELQMGLMTGSLDGRWEENSVLFSFEGMDELDPTATSPTWANLSGQDRRMIMSPKRLLADSKHLW